MGEVGLLESGFERLANVRVRPAFEPQWLHRRLQARVRNAAM